MFGSIQPTAYDLQFRLLGIPVRVSVWFWLMAAILGYSALHLGLEFLLAWMLVVFVSILVHEFGHALTARAFGYSPRILLYQFGGLAMYEPYRNYTRGKSMLITLAGPAAGFGLFGLTVLVITFVGPQAVGGVNERTSQLISFVLLQMWFVNLFWSILNLMPVLPLDGGRLCQELCMMWRPRQGLRLSYQISALVAGGLAAFLFTQGITYGAVMFGLLCIQSISALREGH